MSTVKSNKNRERPQFLWLDLEMTAVDNVPNNSILELAMVITDGNLTQNSKFQVVIHHEEDLMNKQLSSWSADTHERTGLLREVRSSSITQKSADDAAFNFLKSHQRHDKDFFILSGCSIHVDKAFLQHHMPRMHTLLSYTVFDVTTLKTASMTWSNQTRGNMPKFMQPRHRAMNDVLSSIALAAFFKNKDFTAHNTNNRYPRFSKATTSQNHRRRALGKPTKTIETTSVWL